MLQFHVFSIQVQHIWQNLIVKEFFRPNSRQLLSDQQQNNDTYSVHFDLSDNIVYDLIVSSWHIAIWNVLVWNIFELLWSHRIQFDFRIIKEFLMLHIEHEW